MYQNDFIINLVISNEKNLKFSPSKGMYKARKDWVIQSLHLKKFDLSHSNLLISWNCKILKSFKNFLKN